MNLKRPAFAKSCAAALLIGVLAACSSDTTSTQPPTTQLSEAETNAALSDLSGEMLGAVFSMQGSVSSAALQQLPTDAAGFPLTDEREEAEPTLPRGRYVYNSAEKTWQREADSDDLSLTWPYSGVSAEAEATVRVNWNAGAETVSVTGPKGETLEAPTAFNFNMVAAEQEVANVDFALSYYNTDACGTADGIAEPVSLSVNGAGDLLTLENVGFNSEADAETTSQGSVTLNYKEGTVLEWNLSVNGEREREDCFTSDYTPTSGSVEVSLASNAGSFALGLNVDSVDVENESVAISEGSLQIDGKSAVDFAGTLDDANENGVPGENVTLTFAGGKTVTLEQVLQKSKLALMLRAGR